MSTPAPSAVAAVSAASHALRVVLFGMPDAGKSSLLGALAQAAQIQERRLHGRLTDLSQGLAELQHRVYDGKPRETLQEIVPYPVRYEPFRGNTPDPMEGLDAVLFDCDGRAANQILTREKKLGSGSSLGREITAADALILVVDASATNEQLDNDFGEFFRFLHLLQEYRAHRSDVGGLPIFLVLSKCDLLSKPGESALTWSSRVEERKQQVEARFKEFLAEDEDESSPLGFGWVDMKVEATAVRQPDYQGPGGEREPMGVAELFRAVLHAADDYRTRLRNSTRRLVALLSTAAIALVIMLGGAVYLALHRESIQRSTLERTIESHRAASESETASKRLSGSLQRKISELREYEQHPDFAKMSAELQQYVRDRLRELRAYDEYRSQLAREPRPGDSRTPEELARLESRLKETLGPPAEFQSAWTQTEAELLRQKLLNDIKAMRRTSTELIERNASLTQAGLDLLQFRDRMGTVVSWGEWHDRMRELLARVGSRIQEIEPIRDSVDMPVFSARAVTYGDMAKYRPVDESRREWEAVKRRLERVRDISISLGEAGDGSIDASPLKLPEAFTQEQARVRAAKLTARYPGAHEWSIQDLPDGAQMAIRNSAQDTYRRLIKLGREIVLAELRRVAGGAESHEAWLKIAAWLPAANELAEWRSLIEVAQRLIGDVGNEPSRALAEFVKQPSIGLRFRTIRVTIPDDIRGRMRPLNGLKLFHKDNEKPALEFRKTEEEVRDNRRGATTFSFVLDNDQVLTYTPGDHFEIRLVVRDDEGRDWQLEWYRRRSEMYRFEAVFQSPQFYPFGGDVNAGSPKDVPLGAAPELPRVPDLMPTVPAKL